MNDELTEEKEQTGDLAQVLTRIDDLLRALYASKPNDRSELDRIYAVAITDVQRVYAWWSSFAFLGLPKYEDLGL